MPPQCKTALCCFLAAVSALVSCCTRAVAVDLPKVIRYELKVQLVPSEERMSAAVQMTINNCSAAPVLQIPLLLNPLLLVETVADENQAPLDYRQAIVPMADESKWRVNSVSVILHRALLQGHTTTIAIRYKGAIRGYQEIMPYVRDHIRTDYTLLRPDALAYPMLAKASAQSYTEAYEARFTYQEEIAVPNGFTVASGGIPQAPWSKGTIQTFRFSSRVPTWRMDIAVARFKVVKNRLGNLVVYSLSHDQSRAETLIKEMQRVLTFYSNRFGKTNRANVYTVIEIPDGWGSQASDFYILQESGAFRDPNRIHELYHEIAHSWNATAKPGVKATRWFDEGFASYFEALAIREFQGQKAFDDRMAEYRQRFLDAVASDSNNGTTPIAEYGTAALGDDSYTKGAWALFVLNELLGDETFDELVRTFLATYAAKPAGFEDFQGIAVSVSKRDLSLFFNDWIFGAHSSELLHNERSVADIVQRYAASRRPRS
jgi:hypothetical protein